jgi:periplasmic protein TonB
LAKAARVSGSIIVELTVDEYGNTMFARALLGHPLLKDSALRAARGWRFKPKMVSGVPVTVIGDSLLIDLGEETTGLLRRIEFRS